MSPVSPVHIDRASTVRCVPGTVYTGPAQRPGDDRFPEIHAQLDRPPPPRRPPLTPTPPMTLQRRQSRDLDAVPDAASRDPHALRVDARGPGQRLRGLRRGGLRVRGGGRDHLSCTAAARAPCHLADLQAGIERLFPPGLLSPARALSRTRIRPWWQYADINGLADITMMKSNVPTAWNCPMCLINLFSPISLVQKMSCKHWYICMYMHYRRCRISWLSSSPSISIRVGAR